LNELSGITGVNGVNGGFVSRIVIQSDNRILIGGLFPLVNGQPRNSIARLMPDGALDESLQIVMDANSPYSLESSPIVDTIELQDGGRVICGGQQLYVNNGCPIPLLRRWLDRPSFMEGVKPANGTNVVTIRVPAGITNRIQFKTNLDDSAWIDLPGEIVGSANDAAVVTTDEVGNAKSRFYRLVR
jgi:hypothetical protein